MDSKILEFPNEVRASFSPGSAELSGNKTEAAVDVNSFSFDTISTIIFIKVSFSAMAIIASKSIDKSSSRASESRTISGFESFAKVSTKSFVSVVKIFFESAVATFADALSS